ncbi:MAG TPA: S-layer homology domain-containing protein [Actinobacteria bacterium]|nr:S-layer homology domain-containing protein [Actinomycetota bacterium]
MQGVLRRLMQVLGAVAIIAATLTTTASAQPPTILAERFDTADWNETWVDWRSGDDLTTTRQTGYRTDGLGVTIGPGQRRGTGAHYRIDGDVDEAWFRYYLRLENFVPITSGKFPGFAGMPSFTARGCFPSTAQNPGWSARTMFTAAGEGGAVADQIRLGTYLYHVDQAGSCGDKLLWDANVATLDQDRWYCVEGRVALNTPGENNGSIEGWIDGTRAYQRNDIQFRRAEEADLDIRTFWLNIYFGGSTVVNDRDLGLTIDELMISTEGQIGCVAPFWDSTTSLHRSAIEALAFVGIIRGCAYGQYCPEDHLTRAQTLALIDRMIDAPATTVDAFDDDNGHWAEAVLNRLAPLGIVSGCAGRSICPDDEVTRGQFAAFVTRAFDIPGTTEDFFTDDDGSLFESSINQIASIGITRGCDAGNSTYCPQDPLTRAQAASLLFRVLQWQQGR